MKETATVANVLEGELRAERRAWETCSKFKPEARKRVGGGGGRGLTKRVLREIVSVKVGLEK